MHIRNITDGTTVDIREAPLTEDEVSRLKEALLGVTGSSLYRVSQELSMTIAQIEEERRLIAIGRDFYRQLQKLPGVKVSLYGDDPLVDQWHLMTHQQRLEYGRAVDRLRQ